MEWVELILSFIEKQTGHMVTLGVGCAWAVVAALLFYTQRDAIAKLIESISEASLKIGNNEAKIGTRKLEELTKAVDVAEAVAVEKVPEQLPAPAAPDVSEDREEEPAAAPQEAPGGLIEPTRGEKLVLQARKRLKFRDSDAYSTPAVTIERAWQEVRASVYKLLGIDRTAKNWFDLDGLPDEQLISKLKADPRVDIALLKAIVELKMIRNDAITTIGWQPTQNEGRWYLENAQRVVGLIGMAASKMRA